MEKNQNNLREHQMMQASFVNEMSAEQYFAPEIEVLDIEFKQNILGGSPLPPSEGDPWNPS